MNPFSEVESGCENSDAPTPREASAGVVLHVLDHSWPTLSGYSVRSRGLISAQHRLGQPITALTGPLHELDDSNSSDVVVDGVSYLRTPIRGGVANSALRGRWPVAREWHAVRLLRDRILRLIDSRPISLIYAHSPALCGLAGLQAARRRGLPFVYEIRAFWEDAAVDQKRTTTSSLRYRLSRGMEAYVANRADAVSAIAQPMLRDLRSRGVSAEKLFHVPNGVDASQFSPVERDARLAEELGVKDEVVFGFFGSLYRYEGMAWLIEALAELRSRGNRFRFIIVGAGEDEVPIRDAIQEYGAEEYIRALPRVSHEQIKKYYSIVDVMVFPRLSVRLTEMVTPLKPLEAMSLQKAVLASDVGGHRELVEDEKTGLLFRSGSVADFCEKAERLVRSEELRKQLGKRGREAVLQNWDWKEVARRYQRIYDFVLQRQSSNPGQLSRKQWVFSPDKGKEV
jgi:PEP-CTERM/exosortase A-associated glycosyltransferase